MPKTATAVAKVPKKKITLDDLAAMCMREFTFIHEKMDHMEARLKSKIDALAITTKKDMADFEMRVNFRFDRIEALVGNHDWRIRRLEEVVEMD